MQSNLKTGKRMLAKWLGLAAMCLQITHLAPCQSKKIDRADAEKRAREGNIVIYSEVKQIDGAEVREMASNSNFYPELQPDIYWHDAEWKIDLVHSETEFGNYSVKIRSRSGTEKLIKLDDDVAQVDSIYRASRNKAVLLGGVNGMTQTLKVIDLPSGAIVDGSLIFFSLRSPNRRFFLYKNWYQPHIGGENRYTLYDTLKTPEENNCGHWDSRRYHKGRTDEGIQVFPQVAVCSDGDDDEDDNMASNFAWAADSSRIVFADAKSGAMSLVVVTMPAGERDIPRTLVYPLVGKEDVCAGNTVADGERYCDFHVIKSIEWDGDVAHATFLHQSGSKFELDLRIPLSKFTRLK